MKFFIALFFVGSLTLSQAQLPTENLIACYNFESDASDGVNDYDGTLFGEAETNSILNIGSNDVDRLSIPGEVLSEVSEYTVAVEVMFMEFNVDNQSSSNTIFSGATAFEDNFMTFSYAKDQLPGGSATLQNLIFYLHDDSRYEFNEIDLEVGVWYHFTLVRELDAVRFYLDGLEQSPVGGISVPPIELSLHPEGFIFGQDQDILAGAFADFQSLNGSLDNLLIYDRAITSDEVWSIYNCDDSTEGVNSSNSCSCDQSTLSLDIRDNSEAISYFPNPVEDVLQIRNTNTSDPIISLDIIDFNGKLISVSSSSFELIDTSALASGIYLLRIQTESGAISNQKFVVK